MDWLSSVPFKNENKTNLLCYFQIWKMLLSSSNGMWSREFILLKEQMQTHKQTTITNIQICFTKQSM